MIKDKRGLDEMNDIIGLDPFVDLDDVEVEQDMDSVDDLTGLDPYLEGC